MQTKVQKWGNSLAFRIPKAVAAQIGIEQDTLVDVILSDGKLIIVPQITEVLTLEELLMGVTDANMHKEISTGEPVGNEAW